MLDKPDARPLTVTRGEIRFEDVHSHYTEATGASTG
jgi:hypothetical protein